MKYEINAGEKALQVDFQSTGNRIVVHSDDLQLNFEAIKIQPGVYSVLMNNRSFVVGVCSDSEQRVNVNGTPLVIDLLDAVHLHLRELGWQSRQAPKIGQVATQIPGLITKIFFQVGDEVVEGDPLFLMEAMKMENEIKAPISGIIQNISVQEGETVDKGTNIIEIV